jgi:hypothetical protein
VYWRPCPPALGAGAVVWCDGGGFLGEMGSDLGWWVPAVWGAGRSAVFFFTLRPETVAALGNLATAPPALRLLVEYFR